MNYLRIYNELIEKRKNNKPDGYTEKHHIIPRSFGGDDSVENLVELTAREHYIAHLLLLKMQKHKSKKYHKMLLAVNMMCCASSNNQTRNYKINSRIYESLRKDFSEYMKEKQSGNKNSQFGTMWIYNNTLKISKKISKNEIIPDGWVKGRVSNFEYLDRKCVLCGKHIGLTKRSKIKTCGCETVKRSTQTCKFCRNVIHKSKNSKFCNNECRTNHLSKIKEIAFPFCIKWHNDGFSLRKISKLLYEQHNIDLNIVAINKLVKNDY